MPRLTTTTTNAADRIRLSAYICPVPALPCMSVWLASWFPLCSCRRLRNDNFIGTAIIYGRPIPPTCISVAFHVRPIIHVIRPAQNFWSAGCWRDRDHWSPYRLLCGHSSSPIPGTNCPRDCNFVFANIILHVVVRQGTLGGLLLIAICDLAVVVFSAINPLLNVWWRWVEAKDVLYRRTNVNNCKHDIGLPGKAMSDKMFGHPSRAASSTATSSFSAAKAE